MSASSFQKELSCFPPSDTSSLNAPLQQYIAIHSVLSKKMRSLPNSSLSQKLTTNPQGPPTAPRIVASPWTSPSASLGSCSAGLARSAPDSIATTLPRATRELYECNAKPFWREK